MRITHVYNLRHSEQAEKLGPGDLEDKMGEIFSVEKPGIPLQFTGERMTSDASGQIEYEHLHRYCFARQFCRGKDVVDVAAGEGYGSALLAQVARRVIGVEMATDAVEHAITAYGRPGLHFVRGDVRHLPLQSNSADVVVSFETIEHLYEHELFLSEIRRVLRRDGVLIISSPDSEVYSHPGSDVNPFHVRELTADEFKAALRTVFPHTQFFAQRALIGSAMTIDAPSHGFITFERRSENYVDAARGLPRAPYIVAVASAENLDEPYQTLYLDLTRTAYLLTSRFGAMAGPEQEAALRAALAEREATLAVANARAETSEAEAARSTRQATELAEAIAAAEREARERGAELNAAQVKLAELRDALVVAGRSHTSGQPKPKPAGTRSRRCAKRSASRNASARNRSTSSRI